MNLHQEFISSSHHSFLTIDHNQKAYRRRRSNLCLSCGYDIRATPHRCPECGHTTVAVLSR